MCTESPAPSVVADVAIRGAIASSFVAPAAPVVAIACWPGVPSTLPHDVLCLGLFQFCWWPLLLPPVAF